MVESLKLNPIGGLGLPSEKETLGRRGARKCPITLLLSKPSVLKSYIVHNEIVAALSEVVAPANDAHIEREVLGEGEEHNHDVILADKLDKHEFCWTSNRETTTIVFVHCIMFYPMIIGINK
ncbi:hypothetical protein HK100_006257 [Physocladia obscura]|uniref:Uncharacterized protein n=1 Tax=Physocladia obscura TaxID=109957 RepID=A0AAD5SRZ6_9FUNG|nr:hypothetical protein HK100_006257 [Physocladia obscura]